MKFSESSDYMRYGSAKALGDITAAKHALEACITTPEFRNVPLQHAQLLQAYAKLCFDEGNQNDAVAYYQESEKVAENYLIVKYYFAKFLADKVADYHYAISKCEEIINLAQTAQIVTSDDDCSSEEYIAKATELRAEILMRLDHNTFHT